MIIIYCPPRGLKEVYSSSLGDNSVQLAYIRCSSNMPFKLLDQCQIHKMTTHVSIACIKFHVLGL